MKRKRNISSLIFRLIILFWVITRKHDIVTQFFFLFFLKAILPSTQPPVIGRHTHTWESSASNNIAAVLNQFLPANLTQSNPYRYTIQQCETMTECDMTKSQKTRGGAAGEAFQEQSFV